MNLNEVSAEEYLEFYKSTYLQYKAIEDYLGLTEDKSVAIKSCGMVNEMRYNVIGAKKLVQSVHDDIREEASNNLTMVTRLLEYGLSKLESENVRTERDCKQIRFIESLLIAITSNKRTVSVCNYTHYWNECIRIKIGNKLLNPLSLSRDETKIEHGGKFSHKITDIYIGDFKFKLLDK